jgi:sterol desaturase/sphingolipid hydroxylase (fatty acid hydroxylase superfamily)
MAPSAPATPIAIRDRVRGQETAKIPGWYRPWAHLLGTTGTGSLVLGLGLYNVHAPRALDWLLVPITFVIANAFEWLVHKEVLHKRRPMLGELYQRHTPVHHKVYVQGDMPMRSGRELRLVLIPALGVVGAVLFMVPWAVALGRLLGPNAGWLFLTTAGLYLVTYELSHLSYHLPDGHPVYRLPFVRKLRQHHERHHHPRLMQRCNFNVTVPLFDWLLGTMAKSPSTHAVPSTPTAGPQAPPDAATNAAE